MFNMAVPWWELVIRSIAVYAFLIFILRISGKRQIGQMAPFDLVLLLILSNAVQNSMSGGDSSLIGGLLIAGVLVGINFWWVTPLTEAKNWRRSLKVDHKSSFIMDNCLKT